jgi:hypothetical protein
VTRRASLRALVLTLTAVGTSDAAHNPLAADALLTVARQKAQLNLFLSRSVRMIGVHRRFTGQLAKPSPAQNRRISSGAGTRTRPPGKRQ